MLKTTGLVASIVFMYLFGAAMVAGALEVEFKVSRPVRIIGSLLWPLTLVAGFLYFTLMSIFSK